MGSRRRLAAWPRLLIGLALILAVLPSPAVWSQVGPGASLTVVRGMVAVSRPDGTAVFPAGTGLTLAIGDVVGTLDRTRAIVTFFTGSEIELGSNTTIVIRRLDRDLLDEAQVTVENVSGLTVIRVPPGSTAGSWVQVLSRDTVAVVRSGEIGHGVDPDSNNVTVACVDGPTRCAPDGVAFPYASDLIAGQLMRTLTGRGDLIDQRVTAGASVWDALAAGGSVGRQEGTDGGSGSRSSREERDTPNSSALESAVAAATSTLTPTPTGTSSATATPTSTVSSAATATPTATVTATATVPPTATATPTPTPSSTATATATPTSTPTATPTATFTPTATPPPGTPGPACDSQRDAPGVSGTFTTVHAMGQNSGAFRFSWSPEGEEAQFDIYYEGVLIFTTGLTNNGGSREVSFGPGASTFVSVVVTTGPGSSHWHYKVGCPS